jgi:alcohol dehydrogenase
VQLASLIDDGKLEVVVDRVFPFEEAQQAMAYLESGRVKGKVVLVME